MRRMGSFSIVGCSSCRFRDFDLCKYYEKAIPDYKESLYEGAVSKKPEYCGIDYVEVFKQHDNPIKDMLPEDSKKDAEERVAAEKELKDADLCAPVDVLDCDSIGPAFVEPEKLAEPDDISDEDVLK